MNKHSSMQSRLSNLAQHRRSKAIVVKAKNEKSKKVFSSLAKDLKGKLNESTGYLKPITKINESYQTNTNQTLSFSSGEKVDITTDGFSDHGNTRLTE